MELLIRPMTESDHPRVVEIINSQSPDPTTVEEFARQASLRPPADPVLRLVGVLGDGTVAAYGLATGGTGFKPGHFHVNVRVWKDYQGRGYGTALLTRLESWLREQGASVLRAQAQERHPEALAWAERRGYRKLHHLFRSSLPLAGLDPAPFRESLEQARAAGFRFTSLAAEGTTEENYRKMYEIFNEVGPDIPGQEEEPDLPYELFKQYVIETPRFHPEQMVIAVDGADWAAFTYLIRQQDGSLYHQFTGVRRPWRGRGLATAVKVAALLWAREQGVPRLATHNDSANARMLAVNRKLGYVPEPGLFILRKEL